MLDNSTIETLKAMHCSAMASELENQLNDSKTYGTLANKERNSLMVDAERNKHQQKKHKKLIWLRGQAVKTLASHAGIRGSITLADTKIHRLLCGFFLTYTR